MLLDVLSKLQGAVLILSPSKYWRVACSLSSEPSLPSPNYILPQELASQTAPPSRGHGIVIAAYDESEKTGLFRWIGVITGGTDSTRTVEWRRASAQIWVDTEPGRRFWKAGAFGFAPKKVADYGLHELWQEHFDGMELRAHAIMATRPTRQLSRSLIGQERLNPIEIIGEPTTGPKAGVVYCLKSAYGYKVGRTRNVPARMRAFGVHLPFQYTILLCAWFNDCHAAEQRYHHQFAGKRINGEWFDLTEADIEAIRQRAP